VLHRAVDGNSARDTGRQLGPGSRGGG
jgi:hypothetical protein